MPARQLHLFTVPNPLAERLGERLFRTAPRAPGVYLMTGPNQRVLYVGQSKNLRVRLASYKNAKPDRASRKVIRLVRQAASLTWEQCESPEAAVLRENELLRLLRPKFNSVNVYPKAYSFIFLNYAPPELELGRANEPGEGVEQYGAFKTHAVAGYAALLRLTWAALHQPGSPHDFPSPLVGARPPRRWRLSLEPPASRLRPEEFVSELRKFLEGASDRLLQLLAQTLPPDASLGAFQRALQLADLETLAEFYRLGPRRNHQLRARHSLNGPLIPQEQLDDLLASAR